MKAYVCDKCGKTALLDDRYPMYGKEIGVYHLASDGGSIEIDLCEECVEELMPAVRGMEG